jgi:hypothetical protein
MHAPPAYGAPSYPQQQPMPQQYPSAPVYPPQQGYPQPMGYMPPQYGTPLVNPGQGLGVASMVLGILALPLMCLKGVGLLAAIAAVIMGHIAHAQSKRANGQANGMALAGLICGYISLAIVVLIFVFVLVVIGSFAAASRRF